MALESATATATREAPAHRRADDRSTMDAIAARVMPAAQRRDRPRSLSDARGVGKAGLRQPSGHCSVRARVGVSRCVLLGLTRTSESKRARSNGLRLSPSSTSRARHPAYRTFAGVSWRRKRGSGAVALQSSRAAPVRSRAGSCALLTVPIPSGYGPLATATNRKRCRSHGCSRRSNKNTAESTNHATPTESSPDQHEVPPGDPHPNEKLCEEDDDNQRRHGIPPRRL